MSTLGVGANIVEFHIIFSSSRLTLEEDGLFVIALRTWMVFCPRKSGIMDDFRHDSGNLIDIVSDLVDIHTIVFSDLLVVTVPTSVQKNFVFPIFFRVQHVVALLTESDSNKGRTRIARLGSRHFGHFQNY